MSSSIPSPDDSSQGGGLAAGAYGRPAVSPDELLPPVEPPNARFILQLFVVPAVIVAAVVLLWFVIESLARRGEQEPDAILASLRSNNQARFQRANDLANMLRLPQRYPKMKTNRELAQKLAAYVDELVEAGNPAEAEITMRMILITALGEFHVADGLPVLVKAVRADPQRDVRRRALNAIAVLAGGMGSLAPPQPLAGEDLQAALLAAADDEEPLVRSEAGFAIGAVVSSAPEVDPELAAALEELADDPFIDARFNAAKWLARIGSPRAAAALVELFDVEAIAASVEGEKALTPEMTEAAVAANRTFKQKLVINGALKATEELLAHRALPAETFAPLEAAMSEFIAAIPQLQFPQKVAEQLAEAAGKTLAKVKARGAG